MNNSPINSTIKSTTVVELADASSLKVIKNQKSPLRKLEFSSRYKMLRIYVHTDPMERLRLLASANSTTVVELIVELIGELFIVELLNYNFSDFQKACFI